MRQMNMTEGRRLKVLVLLPLAILPMLAIGFMALGGGPGYQANDNGPGYGLNASLPSAHFEREKDLDKMGFYERAAADSARIKSAREKDPALGRLVMQEREAAEQEKRMLAQLERLEAEMDAPENSVARGRKLLSGGKERRGLEKEIVDADEDPDLERLQVLAGMAEGRGAPAKDPQLDQLDGMLDKILAIQQPERSSGLTLTDNRRPALQVMQPAAGPTMSLLLVKDSSRFARTEGGGQPACIPAFLPKAQTITNGATVAMALAADVLIKGQTVPAGTMVYGVAKWSSERLEIEVTSICWRQQILQVRLEVRDLDGIAGIHIPGSVGRETAKQSGHAAIQSVDIMGNTLNPTLATQAAGAGLQFAKAAMGKKLKRVRCQLPAMYRVMLVNKQ